MIRKVILAPQTHTDIGYTELPHKVLAMQVRYLKQAMALCEATATAPQGEQYRWVVEAMIVVREFLKDADELEKKRFFDLVRAGKIEITGFDTQSLTQLLTLQELDEELAFAVDLAKKEKLPLQSMVLDDIGGVSWNLPQVMNRYGIKNFILGVGGWRVLTPLAPLPHLFRYKGVDGQSSALFYLLGLKKGGEPDNVKYLLAQYGFGIIYIIFPFRNTPIGGDFARATENGMTGDQALYQLLKRLENEGYPYDTVLLQSGSDNAGPYVDIPNAVRDWNSRHEDLKLAIGTPSEFFADLESRYGQVIPELDGELTCSWSEHVLTQGRGIGAAREAARLMNRADMLRRHLCLSAKREQEFDRLRSEVLEQIRLFKDHTFGLQVWNSRHHATLNHRLHTGGVIADYARRSWEIKQDYALTAKKKSLEMNELLEQQIIFSGTAPVDANASFSDPDCGHLFVTFYNPLPFANSGQLKFHLEGMKDIEIEINHVRYAVDREVHDNCGSEYSLSLPFPLKADSMLEAKIIRIEAPVLAKSPFDVSENDQILTIKWSNASLIFDKNSGDIHSYVVDGREIQDGSCGFSLNQFKQYQVDGVAPTTVALGLQETVSFIPEPLKKARIAIVFIGAYSLKIQRLQFYGNDENTIQVESEIELTIHQPTLFFRNRVRKIHSYFGREAGYFIFPVKVDQTAWHLATNQQGYLHHFLNEKLPGAALQNFAFQDYAILGDATTQMLLISKQATILSVGDAPHYYCTRQTYQKCDHPHLFVYCYNNLWNTNTAQEQINGDLWFDFIIEPLAQEQSPAERAAQLLNPPCQISGQIPDHQPFLQLSSPRIGHYYSDHGRKLTLFNPTDNPIDFEVKINSDSQKISLSRAEMKTICIQ